MSRIWLIQIGEPLPLDPAVRKMRTGLLADRLVDRGHEVRWWASAFEHQRKVMMFEHDAEHPLRDGLALQILKGCGYRRNVSLRRYLDHRLVAKKFRARAPSLPSPDIIVASMPDYHLAWEAVRYAKARQIPILVDVRDEWPDIFVEALPRGTLRILAKVLLTLDFRKLEWLLQNADGIVAMSEGLFQWSFSKISREPGPRDRIFYMGYKKLIPNQSATNLHDNVTEPHHKTIVYVGTFGRSYELGLLLKAARILQGEGRKDVQFILAGTGEQEAALRRQAEALPNVLMPGWLNAGEIIRILETAWVGVIPCRSVPGALPNKVFEYFSAGLPVVSSLEGEMKEAIARNHLGVNYRAGDLESLVKALRTLLNDEGLRNTMAENAADFFRRRGDADIIYDAFSRHIEDLIQYRLT